MIIGSISENKNQEKRVSITPDIVKKYKSHGFEVLIENNYANHLGFSESDYKMKGVALMRKRM